MKPLKQVACHPNFTLSGTEEGSMTIAMVSSKIRMLLQFCVFNPHESVLADNSQAIIAAGFVAQDGCSAGNKRSNTGRLLIGTLFA
ncbi:hypothetical protein [Advenella mimigardefordensis]|uniref:hypothetical protein n=1 Tax=Advenella mimigardefordensis TaxID=302406 RepID=UPI00046D70AE|nr:hypothetical protein [Advenella mimigardefordensis]